MPSDKILFVFYERLNCIFNFTNYANIAQSEQSYSMRLEYENVIKLIAKNVRFIL